MNKLKEDEVVPEKLPSVINYKIIISLVVLSAVFHYSVIYLLDESSSDFITSVAPVVSTIVVAVVSFNVAYRYRGSAWTVFFKSYIFLGIGFVTLVLGEITYGVYDLVFNIDAYPSIADVFYGLFHIFTILHLVVNVRNFATNVSAYKKIISILIAVGIIAGYVLLTISTTDELGFDFQYGLIFVTLNAVVMGLAVFGVLIFERSVLGKIWLALLVGIALMTSGDIWYYYLELIEGFDLSHPVNFIWYAGYWIMIYSLRSHKKDI